MYKRQLDSLARAGTLAPGSRLPSERDLARALGLSRGTVAVAFNLLCEQGLFERRHGSGTYLAAGAEDAGSPVARLLRPGTVLADLSTSVVPDAAHLRLPALDLTELLRGGHGYDVMGDVRLRGQLRERLGVDPLITNGAQQGIDLIARALVRRGDVVLVEDPTYPGALAAFHRAGAQLVPVTTDADGLDPAAFRRAVEQHRPVLAYLMGVHNPTGDVISPDRAAALGAIAKAEDLVLVEDRTLAELVHSGDTPPPLADVHPHGTVTVGSLSKVLWGGLRVGWVSAAEPLLARITEVKQDADLATSTVSQRLAAALLDQAVIADWRTELVRRRDQLTAALHRQLPEWTWRAPRGGLSVWVRLPGTDTDRFAELARDHGVAIAPGSLFAPTGRHRDHARLSFALSPELLDQAVTNLAHAWHAHHADPVRTHPRHPTTPI